MRTSSRALNPDLRRTAIRIGLQTAGLLMMCLILVGAVATFAVVRSQEQQLGNTLAAAVASAGSDHDRDNDPTQPRGGIQSAVLNSRGTHPTGNLAAGLPDAAVLRQVATTGVTDRRTVHLPAGEYELLTVKRGDDTVQVIANRFEQHQERERFLSALGLAGSAGLVLATLAAAVLASRAVRPMALALDQQRRFVADAGHELRTPLTLLSTRTQLLARRVRDKSLPVAVREGLTTRDAEGIVADTAALTAILEELLLAADPRSAAPLDRVDIGQVVELTVAAAQPVADQAGIVLVHDLVGSSPMVVVGAPSALGRSVTALIDNAVGHASSRVVVRVGADRRAVVVEVTDDGSGIAEDVLPRMFDRFASGRQSTTESNGRRHFGLGLALVSEIAARHGGSVTADNRPDSQTGAVLRLTLPKAR